MYKVGNKIYFVLLKCWKDVCVPYIDMRKKLFTKTKCHSYCKVFFETSPGMVLYPRQNSNFCLWLCCFELWLIFTLQYSTLTIQHSPFTIQWPYFKCSVVRFRGTQLIVWVNYLFWRPFIPSDFLERIVTSNFRDTRNVMSVVFKCRFGHRKKVSYHFWKGDKT